MDIRKYFFPILFIIAVLQSCQENEQKLIKIEGKILAIDSSTPQKKEILNIIEPYRVKMIDEINRVISYAPSDLVRTDGKMQSSLGNLLADLCFDKADSILYKAKNIHADFAFFNYGGIRAGINKGEVTNKHVFELMPFDNTLVIVEMTPGKVTELVDFFIASKRAHPISKNIQIKISNAQNEIRIKEKKINPNKTYWVVTSNYLQSGGDNMVFFANPESLYDTNYLVRKSIQDYFESKDTLTGKIDNRIIIEP